MLKDNNFWKASLVRFWIFLKPTLPQLLLNINFLDWLEIKTKKLPLKILIRIIIILSIIYQLAFFRPKKKPLALNSRNKILETLNFLWTDLERPLTIQKFLILILELFILFCEYTKLLLNNEKYKRWLLKLKRRIFFSNWSNSIFIYNSLVLISFFLLHCRI